MSHEYDKIIKENLESIFLPLSGKYFGFVIKSSKKLTGKLQTTIEREPDFLRLIETTDGQKFILHVEFQSNDERDMAYRMAEYRAILQRKYKQPVRQFVIYLGQESPQMQTQLPVEMQITGFQLANIKDYDYRTLVASDIPEEILLAIFANFGQEPPEQAIALILRRLQQTAPDPIRLQKYLRQLGELSRLRKLDETTIYQIKAMPITYDIKNDYLYKEGIIEGEKKGIIEGEKKGIIEGKMETAERLLLTGKFSVKEVAEFTQLPVEKIEKINKGLKK